MFDAHPTLETQIAASKLTTEECIKLLQGNKVDMWLWDKSHFLWSILHWNWWCIWCGKNHFYLSDKKCLDRYKSSPTDKEAK